MLRQKTVLWQKRGRLPWWPNRAVWRFDEVAWVQGAGYGGAPTRPTSHLSAVARRIDALHRHGTITRARPI